MRVVYKQYNFTEFLTMMIRKMRQKGGEIHKIFWIFNMDGNNYINVEKLHHIQQI